MNDFIPRPQPAYDPHWVIKRDLGNIIEKLRAKEPTDENRESLAIYEEILQRFST
ncbi:hypothetical protein [Pseudarthrobacter oxydans]|uniref:hypothetical protein n=1 Tax=Pseudarthrobacter oxydans TaxID=1671 RepID=UPI0035F03E2F|nr:hypothetical protein GCM10017547_38820 [Pseudarthrobacter oxydans]